MNNTAVIGLRIGSDSWDGEFDFLPFAAHLEFAPLPLRPVEADFHMAVSDVFGDPDNVVAHWRVEAIRERLHRPACELDAETTRAINGRVAARLYKHCREAV
jgi:hypothetical protein